MKLIIKVNEIPAILVSLEKIRAIYSFPFSMMSMYTNTDPSEVIDKLKFIHESNQVVYCPNGSRHSWSGLAQDIELTYDEYTVVVMILRMARNIHEDKPLWDSIA